MKHSLISGKPILILKLGGSILTIDSKFESFNESLVKSIVGTLGSITTKYNLIIVHGAGSFGHYHAKEYNLKPGFTEIRQLEGIIKTHESMLKLNTLVLNCMKTIENFYPISFSPNSIVKTINGEIKDFNLENIKNSLNMGLTPVLFGDVVFDESLGITILSGDKIVPYLGLALNAERIVMLTDVDGVYDDNPVKNKDANLLSTINLKNHELIRKISSNAESGKTRVTGEMEKKLLELYEAVKSGIETTIISGLKSENLTNLVIKKEKIGTTLIIR